MTCVSWNDAQAFLDWLSKESGKTFRLPTEAEWEYTARSEGKNHKYPWGSKEPSDNIGDESAKRKYPQAENWWRGYDDGYVYTAPVGSFSPNELGLYDLGGNVAEWCQDWYEKDCYSRSQKDNPSGPDSGEYRAHRGGSWRGAPCNVRASDRHRMWPSRGCGDVGFRVALPLQ